MYILKRKFTLLAIFFISSSVYASKETAKLILKNNPDIVYIADTNHSNPDLLSVYTDLVKKIVGIDQKFNCVLLETDSVIFQPAIDNFMADKKTWNQSVGLAQTKWEKLTGRSYKKAPVEFLEELKKIGVLVKAVDWSDDSFQSKKMKYLFEQKKLKEAFNFGIDVRNVEMVKNIRKLMIGNSPECSKAVMFVGALHLASSVIMPFGQTKYTSIPSNSHLSELKQESSVILDCRDLDNISYSEENIEQCFKETSNNYDVLHLRTKKKLKVKYFQDMKNRTGSDIQSYSPSLSNSIMIY